MGVGFKSNVVLPIIETLIFVLFYFLLINQIFRLMVGWAFQNEVALTLYPPYTELHGTLGVACYNNFNRILCLSTSASRIET